MLKAMLGAAYVLRMVRLRKRNMHVRGVPSEMPTSELVPMQCNAMLVNKCLKLFFFYFLKYGTGK